MYMYNVCIALDDKNKKYFDLVNCDNRQKAIHGTEFNIYYKKLRYI